MHGSDGISDYWIYPQMHRMGADGFAKAGPCAVACVKFCKEGIKIRSWERGLQLVHKRPAGRGCTQPEPRRGTAPALAPSPYERCQAIFGRLFEGSFVDYRDGFLGSGRLAMMASLERFSFEGLGLQFSLRLPNSYPCIRTSLERSDNLTYSSA